jgi:hypothetical protein
MPPYHAVAGWDITIYLNLLADSDAILNPPINTVLVELFNRWSPIANAHNLTLTFAFKPNTTQDPGTLAPDLSPAGITIPMTLNQPPTPNVPIAYTILPVGSVPPNNVQYFNMTVGRGAGAQPWSRSGRISYTDYQHGVGYIYEMIDPSSPASPPLIPAALHEMGHILGLEDRYYDGVYWLTNQAVDRTCSQIRQGLWVVGPKDFRDPVSAQDNIPGFGELPREALIVGLPMDIRQIWTKVPNLTSLSPVLAAFIGEEKEETVTTLAQPQPYNPCSNLMTTQARALSTIQVAIILLQIKEPKYRTKNWIAILGRWERNPTAIPNIPTAFTRCSGGPSPPDYPTQSELASDPSALIFPTWEVTPENEKERGLVFLTLNTDEDTLKPYPSLYREARVAKYDSHNGERQDPERIPRARGRKRYRPDPINHPFHFEEIAQNKNHPQWMCYVNTIISDLLLSYAQN